MPKLPERVEDWTAPWEESGATLDATEVKRLVFNLKKSEESLKAAKADLTGQVSDLRGELTTAQATLSAKPGEEAAKDARISELSAELTKLKTDGRSDDRLAILRYEAALEAGGLTKRDAMRLVGSTPDELLDDAKELAARFSGPQTQQQEPQQQAGPPSRQPVPNANGSGNATGSTAGLTGGPEAWLAQKHGAQKDPTAGGTLVLDRLTS